MNDEAFARRFYADRAELESLGIELKVDKPRRGLLRGRELLAAAGELLPARRSSSPTRSWAPCARRCTLLDGEFAYAEPLRLALQQLSWGKPSPLDAPEQRSVRAGRDRRGRRARAVAAAVEDRDRDLPPQDDRLRLLHDRPRRAGVAQGRPVPPALPRRAVLPDRLLARARRRARVPPLAHPRQGRLLVEGRARLPAGPRTSTRASTPPAPTGSSATRRAAARDLDLEPDRLAGAAPLRPRRRTVTEADGDGVHLRDRVRGLAPAALLGARPRRARPHPRARRSWWRRRASALALVIERHTGTPELAPPRGAQAPRGAEEPRADGRRETPIRPERFARLVTLAGILIDAARDGDEARGQRSCCENLQVSEHGAARGHRRAERRELRRRQLRALRGGARATRSRSTPSPTATTSPSPRACCRSRRRRWWRRSTCSASTCPRARCASARKKIVDALGQDPAARGAADHHRQGRRLRDRARGVAGDRRAPACCEIEYYKENEDEFTDAHDRAVQADERPGGLVRPLVRPGQGRPRSYRLDRIKRGHRCSDETFEPRAGHRARRARLAAHRRGARRRAPRACGSRPSEPAGRARTGAWSRS